jgi:hypothetical protein
MTITARYNGKCLVCGGRIEVGDPVEWTQGKGCTHIACVGQEKKVEKKQDAPKAEARKVLVKLPRWLAQAHGLPVMLKGEVTRETAKAIQFQGTVNLNATRCCRCGRLLTHPLSVAMGVGPECGGFYGLPAYSNTKLLSQAVIDEARKKIAEFQVSGVWLPKSQIQISEGWEGSFAEEEAGA